MKSYTLQYINGQWREGNGKQMMENLNPMHGKSIYSYRSANRQDVDDAYSAAKAAQPAWAATKLEEKQRLLHNLYILMGDMEEEVYQVLLEEAGSTRHKFAFEFGDSLKVALDAIHYPMMMDGKILPSNVQGKDNYIFKMPKGVICVIAPFNFPFLLALRSVIPAIACGNAVVLKPSTETPASAFLIAEMFEKAGFPKGLLNCIAGRGSEIGDYIVSHPTPSLISFTGSTEVGQHVGEIAGKLLKDVSLELGGNQAMLILDDADVEQAAKAAVIGTYSHQGQICMALNRIIATPKVYDTFIKAFVKESRGVKAGNPAAPDTIVGPLINSEQVNKVKGFIEATVNAGARVALEGKFEGNVVYPWILADVTNSMPSCKCEVFGPVCSIIPAENEEDAIRIANDTEYGLSNSVFTKDLYHGMQIAKRLESGMAHVNDQSINHEPHVMFGGEKNSGVGRFNGQWVVDKFTMEKWISVQTLKRF